MLPQTVMFIPLSFRKVIDAEIAKLSAKEVAELSKTHLFVFVTDEMHKVAEHLERTGELRKLLAKGLNCVMHRLQLGENIIESGAIA